MNVQAQIEDYIAAQPERKRDDMQALHRLILDLSPSCRLWFLDGKNGEGKTVSNPNIGYGHQTMVYADGTSREFYEVGLSANTTGLSIYIIGLDDRNYLRQNCGDRLGKADVTGYCIKFRKLQDIDLGILKEAIQLGFEPRR